MSLFAFGLGFSASRLIRRGKLGPAAATLRNREAAAQWRARGVETFLFGDPAVEGALESRVVVVSIPPDSAGDPALAAHGPALLRARPARIAYLSTVGVYGDAAGGWVDETSPLAALTPRARARVAAEASWRRFGEEAGVAVDILRLGGIYGPGRSALDRMREGEARAVVKPGQVFNRIHVDDIAAAVEAVAAAGRAGEVYNVVDGEPSPPEAPLNCAATLLGLPPPPSEPFETAALSEMARSFYAENRRIRPDRLRALGWVPAYPSFREGLAAILAEERG